MTGLVKRSRPRRRGYSDVPHGLWTHVELSAAARLILGWLHSHDAGYLSSVTVNRIRREFGTSSVPKYLGEMEDAGFVEVERRGNGQASSIVLLMDPWEDLFTPPPQPVESVEARRDRPGSDDDDRAEIGSVARRDRLGDRAETGSVSAPRSARVEDQGEDQGEDQERTSASPSSTSASERFEKFWKVYPRRAGKPAAKRAFKGAVKRSGVAAIQTGFLKWEAFWRINGTPEEFIPYPATWLNQERYNDEPPQITSESAALDIAKELYAQYEAEESEGPADEED